MLCTLVALLIAADTPALHEMTPSQVGDLAAGLAASDGDYGSRAETVARRALGTPYAPGPLGEGPDGEFDKDPLVDFTKVDCVTYVEQSLALAAARSYDEAVDVLQAIRYREGVVSFEARNHFAIADWVANNRFCTDVTSDLDVEPARVTRRISRREFFERVKAPGLGVDTPDQTVTLGHVASADAAQAADRLPSPAFVVFIGKIDWLFALHCGLVIRDEEGRELLYHASSKAKKVVAVDFVDYVRSTDRYLGFTAYRLASPVKE
ncbi:MAG: DUF1460 domain-containing protein [bacterium]|nr:DUF1460 domain-containing protein [bacterium]